MLQEIDKEIKLCSTSEDTTVPVQLPNITEESSPTTIPSCTMGEPESPGCGMSEQGNCNVRSEAPARMTLHWMVCPSLTRSASSITVALPRYGKMNPLILSYKIWQGRKNDPLKITSSLTYVLQAYALALSQAPFQNTLKLLPRFRALLALLPFHTILLGSSDQDQWIY
jgi:hypothetical protein